MPDNRTGAEARRYVGAIAPAERQAERPGDRPESMDEQRHIALPKLYGAPAYARPPVVAANPAPRPINPDDLPLVAELTAEDLEAFEHLDDPAALEVLATLEIAPGVEVDAPSMGEPAWPGDSKESDDGGPGPSAVAPSIRPRPFSIQDLADRIRGRS